MKKQWNNQIDLEFLGTKFLIIFLKIMKFIQKDTIKARWKNYLDLWTARCHNKNN
jgi:hypothetical protein